MAFYSTWIVFFHGHMLSTQKKSSKLQMTKYIKIRGKNNIENKKSNPSCVYKGETEQLRESWKHSQWKK